jgi:hypothetical protein
MDVLDFFNDILRDLSAWCAAAKLKSKQLEEGDTDTKIKSCRRKLN